MEYESLLTLQDCFQSVLSVVICRQRERGGRESREEVEQLRIFAHYLSVMKIVKDPSSIPKDLLSLYVRNRNRYGGSDLQERVVEGLKEALAVADEGYSLKMEVSSFGGVFPVDAAVIHSDELVAVLEVDGPSHYRSVDGKLRRKDQLKEVMYMKRHPDCHFHRIAWDEEHRIGVCSIPLLV